LNILLGAGVTLIAFGIFAYFALYIIEYQEIMIACCSVNPWMLKQLL